MRNPTLTTPNGSLSNLFSYLWENTAFPTSVNWYPPCSEAWSSLHQVFCFSLFFSLQSSLIHPQLIAQLNSTSSKNLNTSSLQKATQRFLLWAPIFSFLTITSVFNYIFICVCFSIAFSSSDCIPYDSKNYICFVTSESSEKMYGKSIHWVNKKINN